MTTNREVFLQDPTRYAIPNGGVSEVFDPKTDQEWNVLRYELSHFVCKGAYKSGLETILSTYLAHLHRDKQPAVWVSGFYGSGKSHFVRVLQHLWSDTPFVGGARARGLGRLPDEIADLFRELTITGKREGGLWAVAGKLGGNNVRLELLSILFRGAGLPEQYHQARFVIWLMKHGYYKDFRAGIERSGCDFFEILDNMHVSPLVTKYLLEVHAELASNTTEARKMLIAQFPHRDDISDDEMLRAIADILNLQSTTSNKLPCTLIILDELQQYIGQDSKRTFDVQNVVEACSSRFGNHVLFVATGQAALQSTDQLQKLQGRFTVQIMLTDTDVEEVVREVVLQKNEEKRAELQEVLRTASGEIDRHLAGTKIAPTPADSEKLISDYPLLPVRSRLWESILRAIDSSGTIGQLRTQLRIVHEALKDIADKPLGTVIAGDVIYHQQKTNLILNNTLLRDVETKIAQLDDGTPAGRLSLRLCAMIFLIGKLPKGNDITAIGVRATVETLADLLVEDITVGSASLRQQIPPLLEQLVKDSKLMQVGDEYRIQTQEGARWEQEYTRRYTRILANDNRLLDDRKDAFKRAISTALKGISLTQGQSKTPRKFELCFEATAPMANTGSVPVWVRDEWSISAKTVREDAQNAGDTSPTIFVFLPYQDADALKDALVSYAAADETINTQSTPTSGEGQEAEIAMKSKRQAAQNKRDALIEKIINNARVYQGGGNEVAESTLQESLKVALEYSLVRLFPKFSMADHTGWGTVATRAREGSTNALSAIGYAGNIDEYETCKEMFNFIDVLGKKGSDIRNYFMGVGYGWSKDAVDATTLCLMVGGFIRATRNGEPVSTKQITGQNLGLTDFYREGVTVSIRHKMGVRKFITDLGLPIKSGEEMEAVPRVLTHLTNLANAAGGDAPLPERPSTAPIQQLQILSGNEQFVAVHDQRDQLLKDSLLWKQTSEQIARLRPRWELLQRLLAHASQLPVAVEVTAQVEAIKRNRSLLENPDPVPPLISQVAEALRQTLSGYYRRFCEEQAQAIKSLEEAAEWQGLEGAERQRKLLQKDLGPIAPLKVGTDEELLATLDISPLHIWEDKIAGPQARAKKLREEAIQLQAPQAEFVKILHTTLYSPEEAEAYLTELRTRIMRHIEAGKPVAI